MNRSKEESIYIALSEIDCLYMSQLDEIELCKRIIERNPRLIKDYPSLEEALKLINHVIESEQSSRPCKE